jgi:hypothetical protein
MGWTGSHKKDCARGVDVKSDVEQRVKIVSAWAKPVQETDITKASARHRLTMGVLHRFDLFT